MLKLIWNLLAIWGLASLIGLGFAFWWLNTHFPGIISFKEAPVVDHPALDEQQEQNLRSIGVDVSALPNEITPEMEDCFVQKLGQERVDAIKSGSQITATDYLKARGCL